MPGQALDTAVQDGLAQVIVSDDDEGLCHNRLDTVDLEIFMQRNFRMINFREKIFFVGTTPYRISINNAH